MNSSLEQLEQTYIEAIASVESMRSARNARQEDLNTAQVAFSLACRDLVQAEERLHEASEKLTDARTVSAPKEAVS